MNNEDEFVKYTAYLASTFAAISHINDNQNYLSQAISGRYLGLESVDAVNSIEYKKKNIHIQPLIDANSYGLQLSLRW